MKMKFLVFSVVLGTLVVGSIDVSAQARRADRQVAERSSAEKLATTPQLSPQAVLLTEDFNYTAGTALTANGWTAHSGAGVGPVLVTSPGLTYPGYAGSGVGNAASLQNTGAEDVNRAFSSAANSGTVYLAAMVNVSAATTTGDYFLHMIQSGTTFYGRVFVRKDPTSANYQFGIVKSSPGAVVYEPTFSRVPGTTYLVVVKYTFNGVSTTDDTVELFVNPTPGAGEPAPTLTADNTTTAITDATTLISVALRQGGATTAPNVTVDGIRVAATFAEAVATALTAGEVSISGRVIASDGRGLTNARITVSGDTLSEPLTVVTGRRGGFTVDGLTAGETYVVTVVSRRFTFDEPSRVITLTDSLTGFDFIADGGRGSSRVDTRSGAIERGTR